MYQDWAWEAFVAINATTRVGQGFSEISDVNAANGGSFENVQESFLFAEVMKYSYLIHAPVSTLSRCRILFADGIIGQRIPGSRQRQHESVRLQYRGASVEGCGTSCLSIEHLACIVARSHKSRSDGY